MDYEKLYREALERARRLEENSNGMILKKWLWNVFPELKESEDERIRKALIEYFNEQCDMSDWNGVYGYQVVAWLEKQGEQKPTLPKWKYKKDHTPLLRDSIILNKYGCVAKSPSGAIISDAWVLDYDELAKLPKEVLEKQCVQKPTKEVKSKFKVGDWVVFNDVPESMYQITSVYQIEKIENFQYTLRHILGGSMPLSFSNEEMIRLWTIADAKDGDVLQLGMVTAIFKKYIGQEKCLCYCSVSDNEFEIPIENNDYNVYGCIDAHPATKEQRELLFKKMEESGYVWDEKNKELKLLVTNGGDF